MSLSNGTRLGPYEILSPIGAGGMGEVYKARDTRLGRDVAVKVLPAEFASDTERLRRFEQEARATAALDHPNILAVYDIGTHGGSPYIVEQFLEGETLRARLREGALTPARAMEFGVQIAQGLAAAHEKGIVHRDLKPENLFVTRDGRLKILDFGLARLRPEAEGRAVQSEMPTSDGPTRQGMVLGTVGYMSPEQVRGQPADARSDIFSFGCVLYEMVAGRQAFSRETSAETMTAILREEPTELAGTGRTVPPGLERIVRRCLEKVPEQRFQSARDLAFALQAFSGLTGTGAALALPGAPSVRRWSFRPWVVMGVLCAALALVAAVVFLLQRGPKRPPQPVFRQVTFYRGFIGPAFFTPDGKEVLYSAAWNGNPQEVFSARLGSPESRSLGFGRSQVMSVFPNGDLLIQLLTSGALAQAPLNGGAPREILEGVAWATVGPDPQHICIVRSESGASRLEYPVGKVLYQTSKGINVARVSHKGDRVAFSVSQSELMLVGVDGKAASLTQGWAMLIGLAWSPSDDEIWFTGSREGQNQALYAVTPGGKERLIYRAPGMLFLADISADGKVLLCRQTSRFGLVAWDAQAGEERDLTWFDSGNLAALSADGSRVLFHEDGEAVGAKPVIFLRGTDGSPPVRLGEGYPCDLSPDGQWVIANVPDEKAAQLQLIPTGAGQPRALTNDGLNHQNARWMPDGKRLVFLGNEPGHALPRFYVQPVEGGAPKPLTPEGDFRPRMAVSPDGRDLAYFDQEEGTRLVSFDGGTPRAVPGAQYGDFPITFSADGRALLVSYGRSVFRIDLSKGQRSLVRSLKPADLAGIQSVRPILITPDEKTYAYGYYRELSDLFVAEGLK